jgi:hypothetical protein
MSRYKKLLYKILDGHKDKNISFKDLCLTLEHLNFNRRIRGDHYIFTRYDINEIINIQPRGNMAKPYQVKQIRYIINLYELGGQDDI